MSYLTPFNPRKKYVVVDEKGEPLEYFRLKIGADKWIQLHKKEYFEELKVIINDKL